ncbi:MoaD/ThiS family protein [Candidatus Marithrix sp. Canyon 246]|uniref:MoaD/ThiS family protein n=1 Tax=Candidatus Marithrix sp. Canyon 246 TaxID=1827136 RepID=UPI000849FF9E|nr:MoaD/ThiS family protein [Candidatus Marithrix sp. Canyon 246]
MKIKIKFFASLRTQIGQSQIEMELDNPLTANLLIAINQEYADKDAIVNAGDEVAFFPPVTGG